jgi:hypothetical protein
VLFPFLVVLSPTSWFWQDGRYVVFVVPMLVIVLVVGCAEAARRVARARGGAQRGVSLGRLLASGLFALVMAVSLFNFGAFVSSLDTFFSGWTNPDAPTARAIADLEASGIRYGYADYWVAYRVDLLSDGRLQFTTAGADDDRWESLDARVKNSPKTAWLFVPMTETGVTQFADTPGIEGPGGIDEAQFLSALGRVGVPYRVVDTGLMRAVIS